MHGVILLDALYGETEKFDRWLDRRGNAFFFSAYTESSQPENLVLQRSLAARHVPVNPAGQPPSLRPGSITFLAAGQGIRHNDFLTDAWVRNPLAVVLATIDGFRLRPAPARPHAAPPRTSPHKAPGAR
jgi:hypothetical protein